MVSSRHIKAIDADDRIPIKNRALMEQAAEYLGIEVSWNLDIGDGESFVLFYRDLLPADQARAYLEHKRFMKESLDMEDSPHPYIDGKTVTQPKNPPQVNGEVINPDEDLLRRLMACDTRPEVFDRYQSVGGVPGLVQELWSANDLRMLERRNRDSKS